MDVDFAPNLFDVEGVEFVAVVHFQGDGEAGETAGALNDSAESPFTKDTHDFEILY